MSAVPHSATARVAYAGAIHHARPHAQGLQLTDGRVVRVGTDEPELLLAAVKAALTRMRASR